MLEIFVIAYCLYFAFNIYTSFMQIGYVKDAKKLKPIILDAKKYEEAGNYAIEKEKMAIVSSFYDFILFILWIGFGLTFLDSLIQVDSMLLKAVAFVNAFIIINWILGLPFELYSTFNLNKKYESDMYFFSDFKKKNGLLKSQKIVKEYDMYRQQYCGCAFSYQDYLKRGKDD